MIEHDPWIGPLYASEGIEGQRLGIVGYSHWGDDDHTGFTVECMQKVISGEWKISFFNNIANYFGMATAEFYSRVIMFEFIPCSIGGGEDRYKWATREQAATGGYRMLRIAGEHGIEKLLIFSKKGWSSAPATIEEAAGQKPQLGDTGFPMGHYHVGDRQVTAIGLRHPQYAVKSQMKQAVEQALAL